MNLKYLLCFTTAFGKVYIPNIKQVGDFNMRANWSLSYDTKQASIFLYQIFLKSPVIFDGIFICMFPFLWRSFTCSMLRAFMCLFPLFQEQVLVGEGHSCAFEACSHNRGHWLPVNPLHRKVAIFLGTL